MLTTRAGAILEAREGDTSPVFEAGEAIMDLPPEGFALRGFRTLPFFVGIEFSVGTIGSRTHGKFFQDDWHEDDPDRAPESRFLRLRNWPRLTSQARLSIHVRRRIAL